ncbi:CPBP family intramembrane glutamic endopeptidase [Jannaschia donghaensis]|nr:type II CAAX endopeptidase family protein [Jannaschia donghaensis]
MWTHQFDRFVAPARGKPQLWRGALGVALIALGYVAGFGLVIAALVVALGQDEATAYLATFETGGTPTLVVMFLAMFAVPLLAVIAAAKWLHQRSGRSLFGPHVLRDFVIACVIAALIYGILGLALPVPFVPVPNVPPSLFLSFLPVALVAIAIQTGAEELAFRGYLQQQLAARFRTPLVWMLVPSVAFGLLHVDPSAGWGQAWTALPPTLFGLIAADLTRITGSIGMAWGLHFLNNCSAILLISLKGNLSGLALYTTPFGAESLSLGDPLIWQEMLITVIVWVCLRLWLARRSPPARHMTEA